MTTRKFAVAPRTANILGRAAASAPGQAMPSQTLILSRSRSCLSAACATVPGGA